MSSTWKIAHVITRWLKAGSEENTLATCVYQLKQGHEVTLIYGEEYDPVFLDSLPKDLKRLQVPSMVHKIDPVKDLQCTMDLRRIYRQEGYDVVHTHQSKAGIVGRFAAAGLRKPVVVHTVHIAPFLSVSGAAKTVYLVTEQLGAKLSDRIINVSEGMKNACLDHKVGTPEQHVVIHSGMPIEKFQAAEPPADWRTRIGGWPEGPKPRMILMLAAFEPRKRQKQLIEAIAPMLKDRSDVCLMFGGQGTMFEDCKALVSSLGAEDKIRFLGYDANPQSLVAMADVCVLTSEREGLPRVVVQYLAGGKPAVVMDLAGIDEIVTDGVNGLVLPADDFAGFSRTLLSTLDDPARLGQLAEGARRTNVSKWAVEEMGKRISEAYDHAIRRRA
ncbi:glycosyltransferase [Asticcacaulis solisilvae]|uniref:glycosyltransferase n=1 Tax=Asticcacaulis solisilvae TaxID=1217274 RepID=UPI003FD7424C